MNGMKDNHIKVVGAYLNQTSKEEGLGDSFLGPTMRNSRLRTFLYAVVLGVMCLTVFLLSTTHSRLKDIEGTNEKCQQQRDSLSAQLQVVYEHKNRLEKSLQQEKTDHRHTKEVFEKQLNEVRVESERDKHAAESKYNSLLQEHETIQNKHSQLQEQLAELRNSFSQLEDEKKQIDSSLRVQLHSLQEKKDAEINKLHAQLNDLLGEKDQLQQINMNTEWKIKQNTEALHLCQLQYQQLQEQLSLQLQKKQSTGVKDRSANKAEIAGDIEHSQGNDHNEKGEDDNTDKQKLNFDANIPNVSKHEVAGQPRSFQQKVLERPNIHLPNNNKVAKLNNENSNLLPEEAAHKNLAKENSLEVVNDQDLVNHANRVLEPPAYHNHDMGIRGLGPAQVSFEGELPDGKSPEGEQEHLPQVQPPHNFDKVEEKHQDEEGRNDDAKHQLEQPAFHNVKDSNRNEYARLPPQNSQEVNPNHIAPLQNAAVVAQDQGVLAKPPAEDSIMGQLQSNHNLNKQKQGHDNKGHGWVEGLKRGPQVVNKRNVVPAGHQQDEDGDYVEDGDDDDDQGDDDQVMAGQGVRGKVFQDADFDDQDNLEVDEKNVPNQDKEEGVMVAPK